MPPSDPSDKILAVSADAAPWGNLDADVPPVPSPGLPKRVDIHPEAVEQGLVRLVLSIVELIRQLLERQAVRRVESGHLDDAEIERLGLALMHLERRMTELKTAFGLSDADLRLDLGPINTVDTTDLPL